MDDVRSPLLPPDEFVASPDNSVDGTPRTSASRNPIEARSNYRRLQGGKCSVKRQRHFVYGAIYNNIFPGSHVLDPIDGNIDLYVILPSMEVSIIEIRLIFPDEGKGKDTLLSSVLSLGRSCHGAGNSRGSRVGDLGMMHALGVRSSTSREVFVGTNEKSKRIERVSNLMRHWMEDNLRSTLKSILDDDTHCTDMKPLSFMPAGPGSRVILSVDLANAPHYDTNDVSKSVAVWVEEKPGQAENWYFVFPNIRLDGKDGVLVRLRHGTTISWDGRKIFHCTSRTDPGPGNKVYGCMWAASR